MAKCGMSSVVEEGCGARDGAFKGLTTSIGSVKKSSRDVLCAKAMSKSRVFGTRIDVAGKPHLSDVSQTLDGWRIDKRKEHAFGIVF